MDLYTGDQEIFQNFPPPPIYYTPLQLRVGEYIFISVEGGLKVKADTYCFKYNFLLYKSLHGGGGGSKIAKFNLTSNSVLCICGGRKYIGV